MAVVEAQCELSRAEGITALRWGATRRGALYVGLLGVVLIAAGGGLLTGSAVAGYGLIAIGVIELLVAAWVYWVLPARTWQKRLAPMGEMTFLFSNDGVEMRALGKHSSVAWTRFAKVVELPDLYILQLSGTSGRLPVAKRAFPSDSDEQKFRQMVAEHASVQFR